MKTISIFFTLFLLTVTLHAQRDQFTVGVDGLGCPFCAYGLEANFKEVPGISKIKIDLEGGILRFEIPAINALSLVAVQEKVKNAGYTARKVDVRRTDGRTETLDLAPMPQQDISAPAAATNDSVVSLSVAVGGSCDMCKERIEAAAMAVVGVVSAEWKSDAQMLFLTFRSGPGTGQAVQHALALAGHDTPIAKSDKKTYKALPGCCHYR
jgi:periplasmic mercuric ion binding protein